MASLQAHIETASYRIPAGRAWIDGELYFPDGAKGLVVFANGTGATRYSPRDQALAAYLNEAGFAALLLDLLTAHEGSIDESTTQFRYDIPRLAGRLTDATEWLTWNRDTAALKVGFFGEGTGAAAALIAAAGLPALAQAVVSRAGRPDLAGTALARVKAPTLLITGALDETVTDLNRSALEVMTCERSMEIIPAAGNLFAETSALEEAGQMARTWFDRHLAA